MSQSKAGLFFRLFLAAVPVLGRPTGALTRFLVTRTGPRFLIQWVIRRFFVAHYGADLSESEHPPTAYPTLLAFFTRRLRKNARPLAPGATAFLSPCDGRLAAAGTIQDGVLIQAKGMPYRLEDLVGADEAPAYLGGSYRVIYLAPGDYHRVHHPAGGRLLRQKDFPGKLYPVNAKTMATVPGVLVHNRRTAFHYRFPKKPFALIMVTAFNVGRVAPAAEIPPHGLAVKRGQELAAFELGSTVVLLAPRGAITWKYLSLGVRLRMGEALGKLKP